MNNMTPSRKKYNLKWKRLTILCCYARITAFNLIKYKLNSLANIILINAELSYSLNKYSWWHENNSQEAIIQSERTPIFR
jgi:hypothetical protein